MSTGKISMAQRLMRLGDQGDGWGSAIAFVLVTVPLRVLAWILPRPRRNYQEWECGMVDTDADWTTSLD